MPRLLTDEEIAAELEKIGESEIPEKTYISKDGGFISTMFDMTWLLEAQDAKTRLETARKIFSKIEKQKSARDIVRGTFLGILPWNKSEWEQFKSRYLEGK